MSSQPNFNFNLRVRVLRRSFTCSVSPSLMRSLQRGTNSNVATRTCANSASMSSWLDSTWSQTSWRKTTRCLHWVVMQSWSSWTVWTPSLRASCSGKAWVTVGDHCEVHQCRDFIACFWINSVFSLMSRTSDRKTKHLFTSQQSK